MNIAILILAAGTSTRMGTAKQLLPVGNATLLGVTIENALQSKAHKIYCVLGANAESIKNSIYNYNIETIFNPNFETGLSSSIVAGIGHISEQNFDAALILLGDQPLISSNYINDVIATFLKYEGKIVASKYNSTFGVPTLIPKSYFNQLLKLKGDKGAKDFLNNGNKAIIQLKNENLKDIDTHEDYQDYLNSTNSE